jgi:hypothetical protein
LDDRIDRGNIEDFPLARYAAQYRARHARVGNVSSRVKDGVECLFDADKPHSATWVWIYDEDLWSTSMRTMHPEKRKAVPLYYTARLGFRDLAEHLIANAGQWLMPGIAKATLHFTGQYNWKTPNLCDYYWNTAQIPMFVTNWAAPHPDWGHVGDIKRL